jgi:hypothetical protein
MKGFKCTRYSMAGMATTQSTAAHSSSYKRMHVLGGVATVLSKARQQRRRRRPHKASPPAPSTQAEEHKPCRSKIAGDWIGGGGGGAHFLACLGRAPSSAL